MRAITAIMWILIWFLLGWNLGKHLKAQEPTLTYTGTIEAIPQDGMFNLVQGGKQVITIMATQDWIKNELRPLNGLTVTITIESTRKKQEPTR